MIITNCEKDYGKAALESYRRRNEIETLFDDFKNTPDWNWTRSYYIENMRGRLFVIFFLLYLSAS